MIRPVLVPQYPNKRVAVGNSIVQVGKSIAAGGGRVLAPPPSENRIDGSTYVGARANVALASTSSDRIVATKAIEVEDDEYLLALTPTTAWDLYRQSKVAGSMFGKPKLVTYALYGPDECEDHRMHVAAFAEWPCLFNSAFTRENWLRTARQYLSASDVRRMMDHAGVANIGIECAAIDAAGEGQVREPATLGFSGRTMGEKGFDRSLEVAGSVLPLVEGGRFRVTTFGQSSEDHLREVAATRPWIDPSYGLTRRAYYEALWRPAGFTCFSMRESVGLAWLEMLYAGQMGVFWSRPWVAAILPWYPLVTDDRKDVESVALAMLRAPDTVLRLLDHVRERIARDWDAAEVPRRVADAVASVLK